ncbi:MAG: class I SAM-dependent methyltransferase [Candidatus Omnitrophica bacterium]|nr:class I SAM-dependent methyltransferase [Candidatus Omnitrophota bacterium]
MLKAFIKRMVRNYYRELFNTSSFKTWLESKRVIPCPLCGSSESAFICNVKIRRGFSLILFEQDTAMRMRYFLQNVPVPFRRQLVSLGLSGFENVLEIQYYQCRHDDCLFQNVPLSADSIRSFYKKYYKKEHRQDLAHARMDREEIRQFAMQADHISTLVQRGAKVLDVGCAEGHMVKVLRDKGFRSYGIEPSAMLVEIGKKKLGLDTLMSGEYMRDRFEDDHFDLIMSNGVVEHMDSCDEYLAAAYAHLRAGGYLLTWTPSADAIVQAIRRGTLPAEMPACGDYHNVLFSMKYLRGLLEKYGFKEITSKICDSQDSSWRGARPYPEAMRYCGAFISARK